MGFNIANFRILEKKRIQRGLRLFLICPQKKSKFKSKMCCFVTLKLKSGLPKFEPIKISLKNFVNKF